MGRPQSNRSYKVKDKATGLWVTVEATPTPKAIRKSYYKPGLYQRKGYADQHKPRGTA